VERGDVLKRNEDVPVQLQVRDVVEEAVRGEHAVLVVAAKERDLDLFALVLAGVVLDGLEPSRIPLFSIATPPLYVPLNAGLVCSICCVASAFPVKSRAPRGGRFVREPPASSSLCGPGGGEPNA